MNRADSEYIQHGRFRSYRRRRRSAIEAHDKMLRRLYDEEVEIVKRIRSQEWIDLKPPYQKGWNRLFVLRSDVKREKKAALYQTVLDKINTTQWSSRKDFKKKRRRFGKKVYVVREQLLRKLSEREFYGKKFTDAERELFYESLVHDKGRVERVFLFTEPWRFVLQIKPNMITKFQVKNIHYERRVGEISRLFVTHHLRPRLWKILDCSYRWERRKIFDNPLRNVSFSDVLHEHWPDRIMNVEYKKPHETGVSFFCNLFFLLSFLCTRRYLCLHKISFTL
ncbi:MAG: hypothetical protein DI538_06305 [Azospira oryzae]|jgi:hypothetical protein|nr:MAG: hypothetical protein DI538_06305 [Azospira oryzae]